MGITMNNAGTVPVLLIGDGSVAAGIFSHFVSSLARALERAGESVIVYGRDCHTPDDLLNIIESPLKCIIGFQEKFLCCDPPNSSVLQFYGLCVRGIEWDEEG